MGNLHHQSSERKERRGLAEEQRDVSQLSSTRVDASGEADAARAAFVSALNKRNAKVPVTPVTVLLIVALRTMSGKGSVVE